MVVTEASSGFLPGDAVGLRYGDPAIWVAAINLRPSEDQWLGDYGLWNAFPQDIVYDNQSTSYSQSSRFFVLPNINRFSNALISDKVCPLDDVRERCKELAGGLYPPYIGANATTSVPVDVPINFTKNVGFEAGRYANLRKHAKFAQVYQLQTKAKPGPGWLGLSPESSADTDPDTDVRSNVSVARTRKDPAYSGSSVYSILGSRNITRELTMGILNGSMSWGYTAGIAASRTPASLVIGGVDLERFDRQNNHVFSMGRTPRQRFPISIIGLNVSMAGDAGKPEQRMIISPKGFVTSQIDSEVEFLVLPVEVIRTIAAILQATPQHNDTSIYSVSAAQHELLLQRNTTFPLTLARHDDLGDITDTMQVSLDYKTLAFPIKHARQNVSRDDDRQILAFTAAEPEKANYLGRAFLQSVYIMADYERSKFSLSEARYAPGSSYVQALSDFQAAWPESQVQWSNVYEAEGAGENVNPKVIGATIGIAFAFCMLIGMAYAWFARRRRNRRRATKAGKDEARQPDDADYTKPELPGHGINRKESDSSTIHEAGQYEGAKELDADRGWCGAAAEMAAESRLHELDAGQPIYVTLASPR